MARLRGTETFRYGEYVEFLLNERPPPATPGVFFMEHALSEQIVLLFPHNCYNPVNLS